MNTLIRQDFLRGMEEAHGGRVSSVCDELLPKEAQIEVVAGRLALREAFSRVHKEALAFGVRLDTGLGSKDGLELLDLEELRRQGIVPDSSNL